MPKGKDKAKRKGKLSNEDLDDISGGCMASEPMMDTKPMSSSSTGKSRAGSTRSRRLRAKSGMGPRVGSRKR